MSAPTAGTGWAVRVPTGYRVGPWQVTAPIATGSFGSVYEGRNSTTGVRAALKFIAPPPTARHSELAELAAREVAFSRAADGEHLVRTLDTLVVDDPGRGYHGAVVLVMERATGSLQDLLESARPGRPVPGAGRLIAQICAGLAHLHESGWVHGDLKPSNVLVMADGSARLADFGLVTRLDGTHGYGPPLGSPDYQPPERWSAQVGERGVHVRPAGDVWALGVTAHALLTGGSFPFPGGYPGARVAAAQEFAAGRAPLRLRPELSAGWRDFVTRCLTPGADRPSAAALLRTARRLAAAERPARGRPSPRQLVALSVLVATPVVAGGAWSLMAGRETGASTATVAVFNAEELCQNQRMRAAECSLGLALDPDRRYATGNVSAHRVWHGDRLTVDCVRQHGTRVTDEDAVTSATWYRVAVAGEPGGHAWLPAVRTRETPAVPVCAGVPRTTTTA